MVSVCLKCVLRVGLVLVQLGLSGAGYIDI